MRNLVALSATVAQKVLKKVLKKNKNSSTDICRTIFVVGMTGFEPATTRPPDAYSNRAELHPAHFCLQRYELFMNIQDCCPNIFIANIFIVLSSYCLGKYTYYKSVVEL